MDIRDIVQVAERQIKEKQGHLGQLQGHHLQLFQKEGFKVTDKEFYKFTNVAKFLTDLSTSESEAKNFDPNQYQDIPTLFFIDGRPEHTLKLDGIRISLLQEDFFQSTSPIRPNALTHLHRGLFQEGIEIEIEKNTLHEHPLRVLHVSSKETFSAPTLKIKAGANSKLTLIEEHLSLGGKRATISESYFELESGARIEHIQLADGAEDFQHASTYADVHRDASFRSFIFHLGGKLNRRNLDLRLLESGAHGESFNLYLTAEDEHSDISTAIEHFMADTTSEQLAKGILDGNSKGIFTGKIHIHPQAQRVYSSQLNKNLLLSKKAQAHSQPQLEIFADDVKCSHGSTTGQLSDEEIFYFETRGIPHERARTLLAHAFGMEVVLKIKNKEACLRVSELIQRKLAEKFKLGQVK